MNQKLISIIQQSPEIEETLDVCAEYGLPNYYLAGRAITQSVWNSMLGLPLLEKVKDYLLHPQERQRVAEAGRQRCLKSGYSNRERLKWMLQIACESKEK